jgi:hypothetical protein
MRCLNQADADWVARLTEQVRQGRSDLDRAVQSAISERSIDLQTAAIADLCPTGASLADGADLEPHHLVIVEPGPRAYVAHLLRTATAAWFDRWHEVPAARIADREALVLRFLDNGRHKRPWNDGIDPRYGDPQDFIYNHLVEAAVAYLDGTLSGGTPPST